MKKTSMIFCLASLLWLGLGTFELVFAQAAGVPPEDVSIEEDSETATNAKILIGEPEGSPLTGEALEQATEQVGSHLRCPVCQGLSVADSHTDTAIAMMNEARELLAAGFTQEQSLLYFEQSYGEFIRLAPKAEGFNLVVWIAPVAVVLLGLTVIGLRLGGRSSAGTSGAGASSENPDFVDPELVDYLEQVRREVSASAAGADAAGDEHEGALGDGDGGAEQADEEDDE